MATYVYNVLTDTTVSGLITAVNAVLSTNTGWIVVGPITVLDPTTPTYAQNLLQVTP